MLNPEPETLVEYRIEYDPGASPARLGRMFATYRIVGLFGTVTWGLVMEPVGMPYELPGAVEIHVRATHPGWGQWVFREVRNWDHLASR